MVLAPSVPIASPPNRTEIGVFILARIPAGAVNALSAIEPRSAELEIAAPRLRCGVIGAEEVDDSRAAEHVIEVSNRFDGLCHSVNGSYFQRDVDQVETCR